MRESRGTWQRSLLISAVLLSLGGSGAVAQAPAQQGKGDLVIVALVDDAVTQGQPARIVREGRGQRMNFVYLRRSTATSGVLEAAMRALVIAQLEHPSQPGKMSVANLSVRGGDSTDPATIALFARLLIAPARKVGEAGLVPALIVTLPEEGQLRASYRGQYKEKG